VIYTPETSEETVEAVKGVAERAGKVVSMVKDTPGTYGFILNRVFAAARREADKIVADGIATREDIDKAMMTGRNWPVGFYNSRGTRTGWLD
jgi:3-hydroxybutyryl-CoA dehydrogenase